MLFCAPRFAHIWRVRRVITPRFHARFGFAGGQCGRGGARDQASCLVTVLEVLLRAGFVASPPGTLEFCPRKDTLQFTLWATAISTPGKWIYWPPSLACSA